MATFFYKISSVEPVAKYLASVLKKHLWGGERVLWLVSGGSSIEVAVQASRLIANMPLYNLSVSLADERFGPAGHPDSNWQQLQSAGFALPGAQVYPILGADNNLQATTAKYVAFLNKSLAEARFKIGLFGMGADGHTAGIFASSLGLNSTDPAVSYQADSFERITMTAAAIRQLDEAVLYATGKNKQVVLDNLEHDLPGSQQPAQVLKQAGNLIVYNDYKGEKI